MPAHALAGAMVSRSKFWANSAEVYESSLWAFADLNDFGDGWIADVVGTHLRIPYSNKRMV